MAAALVALVSIAGSSLAARPEPAGRFADLPVPGGRATLAALGIELTEHAHTLPLLARAAHDGETRVGIRSATVAQMLAAATVAGSGTNGDIVRVPMPLTADHWWSLLPPPRSGDLFTRLVSDRRTLLLAAALIDADDTVRALLARDRDLLRLAHQYGGAFAVVARRLAIVDGAVAVPGGAGAAPVWQALAGVSPQDPVAFLRALLTADHGRLAWYFDTLAGLEAGRHAAAWGTPPSPALARELYAVFRDSDPQWRIADQPYRRPTTDAWMMLTLTAIDEAGVIGSLPQSVWALLFSHDRPAREQIVRVMREAPAAPSLHWLMRAVVSTSGRERRNAFETFRLGQRMFGGTREEQWPDVAEALAGSREYRALALALERMQVADPRTWAQAMRAARHVSASAADRPHIVPAFQGALAILERLAAVRSLDAAAADRLVQRLADAVLASRQPAAPLAAWFTGDLMAALPRLVRPDAWTADTAYESTLLQALAGPAEAAPPALEWEGLRYTVDLAAAEHDRLRAVRALLPSPGLDAALAAKTPRDLAAAIIAVVYATAVGAPDGPISLSPDVASRHDFGFAARTAPRELLLWAPGAERQGMGPWHVQGALPGLDLALSRLALRRVDDQQMPAAPTLTLNDLGTLTRTAVLLTPSDLRDDDRDEIVRALDRGRARVAAAAEIAAVARLADECGVSHTTRRLLPWMAAHQRDALASLFSLRQLLCLGRPLVPAARLDAWGVAGDALDGRWRTAMPPPAPWEDFAGRSELGQVTTQIPDLALRLAEATAQLRLPARLVPAMYAFALEDYWHDVSARFADDWMALSRQAAAIPERRIHDYVAALVGAGPLRPEHE